MLLIYQIFSQLYGPVSTPRQPEKLTADRIQVHNRLTFATVVRRQKAKQ